VLQADAEPAEVIAVIEGVRVIEPVRTGPPAIVQAAAAAATGFVAGAATAAVLSRRRTGQSLRSGRPLRRLPAPYPQGSTQTGATQTFLVHVQALRRP
jgi:hypothetical protein